MDETLDDIKRFAIALIENSDIPPAQYDIHISLTVSKV